MSTHLPFQKNITNTTFCKTHLNPWLFRPFYGFYTRLVHSLPPPSPLGVNVVIMCAITERKCLLNQHWPWGRGGSSSIAKRCLGNEFFKKGFIEAFFTRKACFLGDSGQIRRLRGDRECKMLLKPANERTLLFAGCTPPKRAVKGMKKA